MKIRVFLMTIVLSLSFFYSTYTLCLVVPDYLKFPVTFLGGGMDAFVCIIFFSMFKKI